MSSNQPQPRIVMLSDKSSVAEAVIDAVYCRMDRVMTLLRTLPDGEAKDAIVALHNAVDTLYETAEPIEK